MRIAVFGATGQIGRELVRQALEADHEIRTLARRASAVKERKGLTIVEGSVTDPDAVDRTIEGTEAVLSALGPRKGDGDVRLLETAARHVIDSMNRHGVTRYVGLSGAVLTVPGDRKGRSNALISVATNTLAKKLRDAKRLEYEAFAASDIGWTLIRPTRATEGRKKGQYRTGFLKISPASSISRADVADFMLRELTENRHLRQAPLISY